MPMRCKEVGVDLSDPNNCPDSMNVRQYLWVLETSPEVLAHEIRGFAIPRDEGRGNRQRRMPGFDARFEDTCCLCSTEIRKRDRVLYGKDGALGHLVCHLAVMARDRKVEQVRKMKAERRRQRDAHHARRRRGAA